MRGLLLLVAVLVGCGGPYEAPGEDAGVDAGPPAADSGQPAPVTQEPTFTVTLHYDMASGGTCHVGVNMTAAQYASATSAYPQCPASRSPCGMALDCGNIDCVCHKQGGCAGATQPANTSPTGCDWQRP